MGVVEDVWKWVGAMGGELKGVGRKGEGAVREALGVLGSDVSCHWHGEAARGG